MMRCVMAELGKMVLLAINVNTEDRHRGWGRLFRAAGLGIIASLALSACNGCAFLQPQPIAVSCYAFTTGHIVNQGVNEGPVSAGESRGTQKSHYICRLIFTPEELQSVLRSSE